MESTIRIERYADQGRCVGHIDGRVVFVRFALPGELVRVVLDEPHDREDRFWTGEVTEVLEASEDRVEPVWPLAGPLAMGGGVGGADLVHVSLPGQLKWKSMSIAEQMRRLGHVDVDVPIERMPEDEAEQGLHWRTRIEMIADENGRPSMRRRGTHVRVPIDTMPLATLSAGRTRMLSVEGGKTAVKHAQRNLRAIHLGNVDARVGDVAKTLANVRNDLAKPDIVVLDPPRAGARAKVCRQIAESGARSVVYIACDPASLARDTATLASLGYDLADIRAFDIYPTTHHVETVALFRKATR